jgi:hypothetical protein
MIHQKSWAITLSLFALSVCEVLHATELDHPREVSLVRVPNAGIQPQVAVDETGVVHMIYFKGDPGQGDLYYVRSRDGGATFSAPLMVNSVRGSAVAIGNIRGGHLAIGKNGRVNVAWNGVHRDDPAGPRGHEPMLYTRLNDAGTAFEPQRNVIRSAYGLDGGGALAADSAGNVYVFWHAPEPGKEGEGNRRVWVARSRDDGKTFEPERPAYDKPTGACGCCGLNAFVDRKGTVYVLYRSATETVHRDIYLLVSRDKGQTFQGEDISKWNVGACVMSSESFAETPVGVLAAWETEKQAYYGRIDTGSGKMATPVAAPGAGKNRKFPAVAGNSRGEMMFAWTEGMGWKQGGALEWQVYGKTGKPTAERGKMDGVPVWSLIAVFTRPDGGFTIMY